MGAIITQYSRGWGKSHRVRLHMQILAARRALSIVNRLPPGPYKAHHASRVLCTMNRLRGSLQRAENTVRRLTP